MRMRRVRRAAADARGFTLIEMVVSIALLSIILGPLAGMLVKVSSNSRATINQDALMTEARSAVEGIVTDVREAYTSSAAMPAIVSMSATQLIFYAPDTSPTFHLRKISYTLTSGSLKRASVTSTNTAGPPWTIAALGTGTTILGSVSNSTLFTYQDANGAITATPTAVSRVLVTVTISPGDGGPSTTYQDSATIRGA